MPRVRHASRMLRTTALSFLVTYSMMMVATIYGHERLVDTLLERGASVDQQNENGFTALMYAAHTGHEGLVDKLLKAGADPNALWP